jgi:hypothetical protein
LSTTFGTVCAPITAIEILISSTSSTREEFQFSRVVPARNFAVMFGDKKLFTIVAFLLCQDFDIHFIIGVLEKAIEF